MKAATTTRRRPSGPMDPSYEVVVVGAGPAGSALAASLARGGRRVALLERDELPRDKLCGEFLSGEAREPLARIGGLDSLLALEPARIRTAVFTTGTGRLLRTGLPREALGVSRRVLDEHLFRHAAACGAATFDAMEVRGLESLEPGGGRVALRLRDRRADDGSPDGRVEADLVVLAHGRRGLLDRDLGRDFFASRHPHVGLQRHHRPRAGIAGDRLRDELGGAVEIHAVGGGYCGLSFVEGDRVNVCMLLRSPFLRSLPSTGWEDVVRGIGEASEALGRRLEALEPCEGEPAQAVGAIPFCSKERSSGPALLVGDAAGVIAPFCGSGQEIALGGGVLLGERLLRERGRLGAPGTFRGLAADWDRMWRRRFGRRLRLGRWMQNVLLHPVGSDLAVAALARAPRLTRLALRSTHGSRAAGRPSPRSSWRGPGPVVMPAPPR